VLFIIKNCITLVILCCIASQNFLWAQYVHPLDYPKVPQVDQIPSEYFLNFQLENPFQLLEQDANCIKLKEAFIFEQDITKIKLNTPNSYEEDFWMPEGYKTTKTSSILQQNSVFNPSNKSQDPELDNDLALTNLIENSLKQIPTTLINNPIDPNLIDSSHQDELLEGIQTYPAHPNAFFHDSSVNQTENSRTTAGKPKDKHPTETLSYNEVLTSYPVYSGITSSTPSVYYNIFESETLESFSSENSYPETTYAVVSRQRRLTTYVWEMTDFAVYDKDTANDFLDLTGYGGDDLMIVLKPLSSGSVAAGTAENGGATQGVASNMPVHPDSGIWSPSSRTYNDFMKITGTLPSSITIDASAVKYYMNWHYGDWDISTTDVSANHYDLVYYSAVPEPSTYFMTGALFCFIGCNRSSRNTIKIFFSKVFMRWKTKDITEDVQDRIS